MSGHRLLPKPVALHHQGRLPLVVPTVALLRVSNKQGGFKNCQFELVGMTLSSLNDTIFSNITPGEQFYWLLIASAATDSFDNDLFGYDKQLQS